MENVFAMFQSYVELAGRERDPGVKAVMVDTAQTLKKTYEQWDLAEVQITTEEDRLRLALYGQPIQKLPPPPFRNPLNFPPEEYYKGNLLPVRQNSARRGPK